MRHNKYVIYVYNLYKGASPVTGPAVKGILHSALFCIVVFTLPAVKVGLEVYYVKLRKLLCRESIS